MRRPIRAPVRARVPAPHSIVLHGSGRPVRGAACRRIRAGRGPRISSSGQGEHRLCSASHGRRRGSRVRRRLRRQLSAASFPEGRRIGPEPVGTPSTRRASRLPVSGGRCDVAFVVRGRRMRTRPSKRSGSPAAGPTSLVCGAEAGCEPRSDLGAKQHPAWGRSNAGRARSGRLRVARGLRDRTCRSPWRPRESHTCIADRWVMAFAAAALCDRIGGYGPLPVANGRLARYCQLVRPDEPLKVGGRPRRSSSRRGTSGRSVVPTTKSTTNRPPLHMTSPISVTRLTASFDHRRLTVRRPVLCLGGHAP